MSVYRRDDPKHVCEALASLRQQTLCADEIVLVEDGPLTDRQYAAIASMEEGLPLRRIRLAENRGLGAALKAGFEACSGELVARMDADDIADPNRFAQQFDYLCVHPEVDVLGTAIEEFIDRPGDLGRRRLGPLRHDDIRRYAMTRNPLNHMTVMFRRRSVLAAGGYLPRPGFEDYDLWLRVLSIGGRIANLPDTLVHARIGNGMLQRRHGLRYLRDEIAFFWSCRRRELVPLWAFVCAVIVRTPARLIPQRTLALLYSRLFRR